MTGILFGAAFIFLGFRLGRREMRLTVEHLHAHIAFLEDRLADERAWHGVRRTPGGDPIRTYKSLEDLLR